jgi:hypothetical protein
VDPFESRNNADNYAMYANAVWFSYYFDDCDRPMARRGMTEFGLPLAMSGEISNSSDVVGSMEYAHPTSLRVGRDLNDPQLDISYEVHDFQRPPDGPGKDNTITSQFLRIMPLGGEFLSHD